MGSNLGFRRSHLMEGLRAVRSCGFLRNVSDLLETPPMGPQDQPAFLNLAAELISEFSPFSLLRAAKRIERRVGRRPTYRWGPRILDIDLLLYDDAQIDAQGLILPHPGMKEREFVMKPLAQIAPETAERIRSGKRPLSAL
jgi:2-amino-4-hydroxy-6-hydroxymethyldihydropteridine diphosphokinase